MQKKPVLFSLLLSCAVVVTTLLAFQNCSDPQDTYGDGTANTSSSSNTSVPGGANNTNELTNTGTSAVNPNASAPPQSLPSTQFISILFANMLNRAPTATESSDLAQYIGLGYGCTKIAQMVMGSQEYATDVGKLTPSQVIVSLFKALLNRSPSQGEAASLASLESNYQTNLAGAGALAGYIMQQGEFSLYCSQYKNLHP